MTAGVTMDCVTQWIRRADCHAAFMKIEPFTVSVADAAVLDLNRRLEQTRWEQPRALAIDIHESFAVTDYPR